MMDYQRISELINEASIFFQPCSLINVDRMCGKRFRIHWKHLTRKEGFLVFPHEFLECRIVSSDVLAIGTVCT